MAWIDDIDVLNNAATAGNWTANAFDSPTLNDSASTTPIYLEGSACMWWPLKKGVTNGYVYTSTISGTPTLTNRIVVGFVNYPFADIDLIPITSMYMRLSSATTFTTNYLQWDASSQVLSPENIPISGHTPVIGYEDAGTETGTFNGNCESVGWVATTGNDADGKQGGFDWFFVIGWIGAHSATLSGTYLSGLASEYYDNEGSGLPGQTSRPIAVFSRSGDFYQSNVRLQLGDGTSDTANLVVTETAKTIFFNNLHANHELGYVFVDPASTYTISFTLTNCVHFWNDQAAGNDIFTNASNAAVFKISGCSFARGGDVNLPPHISASDTFVQNSTFDDCGPVDIGDITFTGNTVSNATRAVEYIGSGTRRSNDNTYNSNTVALYFDTAQTITVDGDTFSGNTYDIENASNATLVDSYTTGGDGGWTSDTYWRRAQSFTGKAGVLSRARLSLRRIGSPTGTVTVKLYAHSGTYGTSSVPTGTALDTSPDTVDISTIPTGWTVYYFEFHGGYTLSASTYYCLAIEGPQTDVSNQWQVYRDNSSPTHSGNGSRYNGTWGASAADAIFEVWMDGILTVNATNGANPATFNNTGTPEGITIIQNAVNITITVKDDTGTAIQNAQVAVYATSDNTQLMNEDTLVTGIATESFNYTGDTAIYYRVRKSSTGATRYFPFSGTGTITSSGFSATVTLYEDTTAS